MLHFRSIIMSDKQKQAAIDTDFFVKLTKKNADGKLIIREISIHISTKARVWGKYEPR